MWLRKPVECRKASSQSERATVFGRNRRLTSRSGRHVSSTLPFCLVLGVLALTGCAAPGVLCQTDCHIPARHAGYGPQGKLARPMLHHRTGHAWVARSADFGYSPTYWHRFPVPSMHGPLPWEEVSPAEPIPSSEKQAAPDDLEDDRPLLPIPDGEGDEGPEEALEPAPENDVLSFVNPVPTTASVSDIEHDSWSLRPETGERVSGTVKYAPPWQEADAKKGIQVGSVNISTIASTMDPVPSETTIDTGGVVRRANGQIPGSAVSFDPSVDRHNRERQAAALLAPTSPHRARFPKPSAEQRPSGQAGIFQLFAR